MVFFNISEWLTSIVAYITLIVGGNEFAAGAVIAGIMGIVSYAGRELPKQIWGTFVKHTTTSLELNSTNESYHNLTRFLHKNGVTDRARNIKIGNGRWGSSTNIKQIGYGRQLFWFNWHTPILVNSYKEISPSDRVKEFLSLTLLGRDHTFFNTLMDDIEKLNIDKTKTKFYHFEEDYQRFVTAQVKRRMDTIVIPASSVKQLCSAIDSFVEKEAWYVKHQIPYQLGILLYGPPGTGKTSLIKAIAAYMDKDICFVDSEGGLIGAVNKVNDSIIVLEEVDTLIFDNRDDKKHNKHNKHHLMDPLVTMMEKHILGKVLNALDGVISNHGRVVILTTNHIEVLDSALLRPGRIDLQLEIGYLCSETFNGLLKRFFPDYKEREVILTNNVSPAHIQNDIILGLTVDELLKKYTTNKIIRLPIKEEELSEVV